MTEQREPEVELDDLEVTEADAEEVTGGAYEAYIATSGTKQGANKGQTSP